jgi:putative NADPH-quinone reductase
MPRMRSKNILIINGNPDPSPQRLSRAIADAYREGAINGGHHPRQIDVGALSLPILRTAAEFAGRSNEKAIIQAQAAFIEADHVVFIYPLWLGGPPALLKAFMEMLGCGQFLLHEKKGSFPQGGLKGRSARVIVTMGMPPLLYRTLFGAHGTKAFNRSILRMSGFAPVRTSYFGGAGMTPPRSASLLEQVVKLGRKAA